MKLRSLSIKSKIIFITLTVTILVIGAGFAIVAYYDVKHIKDDMVTNSLVTAELMGNYLISPLVFEDAKGAEEVLASVAKIQTVKYAILCNDAGETFASYSRDGKPFNWEFPEEEKYVKFEGNSLNLLYPIYFKGKKIGSLYYSHSTLPLYKEIRYHLFVMIALMVVLILISYLLASRFQRVISVPILELVGVMKKISQRPEYSLQVKKHSNDEIGTLYDGFNRMLKQIQIRVEEREKVEADLRQSEERFKTLVSNIPGATYRCASDAGRTMEYLSEGIEEISGYPSSDFIQNPVRTFVDIIFPDDRKMVEDAVLSAIAKKVPFTVEYRIIRADGAIRNVNDRGQGVFDEKGGVVWIDGVLFDISERIGAEEEKRRLEAELRQAQKMEAIGTLAGGIAHDFNNILSIIFGYLDISMMDIKSPEKLKYDLSQMQRGALRARELINQILTLSRRKEQVKQPLRISSIIKEALNLLRSSIPSTITIKQDITSQETVLADATQVHQIIMNLCTNAYHAMRETGGTLTISLKKTEIKDGDFVAGERMIPGKYLILVVSDTGHGMDEATKTRIFDPYFTTKEHEEGTGLGLAVVHGIVKSHSGYIDVHSEVNGGTSFQVYLPVFEGKPVDSEVTMPGKSDKGRNERILFIDDEALIINVAREALTKYGYNVTAYKNGVLALEEFKQSMDQYDLVITDMTMPEMNGLEVAERILKLKPNFPVILCSGYSELIDKAKIEAMGVGFLQKPIAVGELVRTVRKALDKAKGATDIVHLSA